MDSLAVRLGMQFAGRGRLEGHPPGNADNARFEGRFVIFAITGPDGRPMFGEDVSLFDPDAVARHGRGPQSAHLVAVRSGWVLESFATGDRDDFVGHTIGRTSSETRLRIYFDARPDGSRSFKDRKSFMQGDLVATYQAEEYFQINPRGGVFDTRVNYVLLDSSPFTYQRQTIDLGQVAPRMAEISHGHNPEPDPEAETIPNEEPFTRQGPGVFADHFPVGGTLFAGG